MVPFEPLEIFGQTYTKPKISGFVQTKQLTILMTLNFQDNHMHVSIILKIQGNPFCLKFSALRCYTPRKPKFLDFMMHALV